MKRRQFIKNSLSSLALSSMGLAALDGSFFVENVNALSSGRVSLPIPPLFDAEINGGNISLQVQNGSRNFFPGLTTPTLGFNGDFLGPTIRVKNGNRVRFQVRNRLQESTTVHWHGLHVPAKWDGGPRQVIPPGSEWLPDFTVKQQAATLWYHPHAMGRTGEHVYRGLAGLFIIEDDISEKLSIPQEYGVDDIPLIIQDRRFYEDGRFGYVTSGHDIMHGVVGNHLLVNGVIEPQLKVVQGVTRFRLLNGSNSSIYRLSLDRGRPFSVIASDGGFLEQAFEVQSLVFSAGERFEILVDFSHESAGTKASIMVEQYGGQTFSALNLVVGPEKGSLDKPIETITQLATLDPDTAIRTRKFSMETFSRAGRLTINSKQMDLSRIDETITLGSTEIWEISNRSTRMMNLPHSMHLHDVQFQVLERNGQKPTPLERGRKDTVLIMPGEQVRVISRFEDYTGIYMYHCHMLEHEDNGMMGQFEVVDEGAG